MKKIEFYLNVFHFCFYRINYKLSKLYLKISPSNLIHKIPFFKRRYKELGVDIHKEIDNVLANKRLGLSTIWAGGALLSVLFIFILSIIIILGGLLEKKSQFFIDNFYILLILSALIGYAFVFKKDMYLKYFREFEKWSKSEVRKYNWLTFIFVAIVTGLFILSFKFL